MPVIFNKIYFLFDVDLFFMTSIHHILHSMFPPIELPIFFSDSVRQTEDRIELIEKVLNVRSTSYKQQKKVTLMLVYKD
jgi:hypothetical protein